MDWKSWRETISGEAAVMASGAASGGGPPCCPQCRCLLERPHARTCPRCLAEIPGASGCSGCGRCRRR